MAFKPGYLNSTAVDPNNIMGLTGYHGLCSDGSFGPVVPLTAQCRGGFDFTGKYHRFRMLILGVDLNYSYLRRKHLLYIASMSTSYLSSVEDYLSAERIAQSEKVPVILSEAGM